MDKDFLGFPPNTICDGTIKASILFDCNEFIAIEKPADVTCKNIIQYLQDNTSQKKIAQLGITHPKSVFELEKFISGVFLISKEKEPSAFLRNLYGSQMIKFTFDFLSLPSETPKQSPIVCDLPIAKHFDQQKMLISHRTGKKSCTEFLFVEFIKNFEHWQAKCTFLRKSQIQLHAKEQGISIIGEKVYSGQPPLNLTKKFLKKDDSASHWSEEYIPFHLSSVEFDYGNTTYRIESQLPKRFISFINLIKKK